MQGITPTASWQSRDPLPPPIYPNPKDIKAVGAPSGYPAQHHPRHDSDAIGISFLCNPGQAPVISEVDHGSVAHNAGLLTGDRVLSVSAEGTFGLAEILVNGVPTTRVNVKGFPASLLIALLRQTFEAVKNEGGKAIILVERGQGGSVHTFSSIFSFPGTTGSGRSGANVLEHLSRASSPSASQQQLPLPPSPSGQHGLVPLSYLRPLSSTGQKATQPAVNGGKYGCEWHGCGFKDDSFDLVANHEKTCAYRGGQKKNVPSPAPNKAKSQEDSPGSGAPPYSTKAEKGGKYGCEWHGCGFKDDSFDLVASHERTCAYRGGQKKNVPSPAPNKAKSQKDSPGSGAPPYSTKAEKGGKYGCEWGCGFKDDSFDLVANHERTCAMRDGLPTTASAGMSVGGTVIMPHAGYGNGMSQGMGGPMPDGMEAPLAGHAVTVGHAATAASQGMPSQQPLIMGTNGRDPTMVQYSPPADSKQTVEIGFG